MKTLEIESWEDFKKLLDKKGIDLDIADEEMEEELPHGHRLPPLLANVMKLLQGEENEGEWNELTGSKPLGFSITIIKKMPLKKGEEDTPKRMKIEKQDEEARKPIVSEDDEEEVEDEEE